MSDLSTIIHDHNTLETKPSDNSALKAQSQASAISLERSTSRLSDFTSRSHVWRRIDGFSEVLPLVKLSVSNPVTQVNVLPCLPTRRSSLSATATNGTVGTDSADGVPNDRIQLIVNPGASSLGLPLLSIHGGLTYASWPRSRTFGGDEIDRAQCI